MTQLRLKQQTFVEEYLVDLNATQAALRAGYSPRTAGAIGFNLLKKVEVQNAIAERRAELAAQKEITPERVLAEYAALAFADMGDYVSWGPLGMKVNPSDSLPEGATKAITEVTETFTTGGISVKLKLADKKANLDSICRMLGYNAPEKRDIEGHITHEHIDVREAFFNTVDAVFARAAEAEGTDGSPALTDG